jgi:hypothetical protein
VGFWDKLTDDILGIDPPKPPKIPTADDVVRAAVDQGVVPDPDKPNVPNMPLVTREDVPLLLRTPGIPPAATASRAAGPPVASAGVGGIDLRLILLGLGIWYYFKQR